MTGKQDGFAVIFQQKQNGMCVIGWHIPFCFWVDSKGGHLLLWRWVIHLRPRKAKAFRGYRPSMQALIGLSQPCGLTSDGARGIPVGGEIQRERLPQFAIVAQAALRPVLCGSLGLHLPVSATGGGRFRPPWPEESKETGGFVAHDFACKV